MHLYRLSQEQVNQINVILEKFQIGEVQMACVREAQAYQMAIEGLKKAFSKECSDEFVLKEKVDTLPEAEAIVDKIQEEKEQKRMKR